MKLKLKDKTYFHLGYHFLKQLSRVIKYTKSKMTNKPIILDFSIFIIIIRGKLDTLNYYFEKHIIRK